MGYILVVDDDAPTRELLVQALADEGYEACGAENGRAALARIAEQSPCLILLDARMPEMDGDQFLAAYRERPGPHCPIIGLTAGAAVLKTDALIEKPFDLGELYDLVGRYARGAAS